MIITTDGIRDIALRISCVKGLKEMSIGDLSCECGIRKSSIYSHFESKQVLEDTILDYCREVLTQEINELELNTEEAGAGLQDLAFFLYSIFSEGNSGLCYQLIQSEKLRNRRASAIGKQVTSMLTARCEVLLDLLSARGKLRIDDTHYGAVFFCAGLESQVTLFLARQKEGEKWEEFAWEIPRLCEGFLHLLQERDAD